MPFQRFVKVMMPSVDKADKEIRSVALGDQVYTYEDIGGRYALTIKPVINVAYTGVRDCYRMSWRDSSGRDGYTDLTGDHLVRMLDGSYKTVTSIREDMRQGQPQFVLAAGHTEFDLLRITGHQAALGVDVQQVSLNHQITGIELAGKRLYTYDIEVQDTNNFIASEICCHDGTYV